MSTQVADISERVPTPPVQPPPAQIPWAALAWFSALLIAVFFPILRYLVNQWMNDEDVSHGFFVPVVALFIVWQRREKILALHYKPAWWGLAIMVWGGLQAYLGTLAAELYLQRTSFLISLVGLLLVMGGVALVRQVLFPLLLLPFMIPIPAVIYNQLTFPLQMFASQVAERWRARRSHRSHEAEETRHGAAVMVGW